MIRPGDRVRMNNKIKHALIQNSCEDHVKEFENCIGIVQCLTDYNNCLPNDSSYDVRKVGPEWDVRWQPSNLRYAYSEEDLEIINE